METLHVKKMADLTFELSSFRANGFLLLLHFFSHYGQ